ncbi:MSHA biogenesis protein MshP [Vibrio sp. D404a]|uniref:MSHA biogenesis protein MshP n=1 Tax=unclassified Vibrio TaxID=2614977 RepID=UPI002555D3D7|nr:MULTISPECIES: MSHA biogenesis protein MshP [unclassified Vibrio]MDK9737653.1 MSHA biogenesis protein MshP [Vibrio sp. D404a]MDK9797596.1 MSHA biogenesis protein MshP [Vibrio sp. D449a]
MSHSYQQRGSALVIVIFVIVIVGFLATSLTRTSWSTHDTNTRSVMGTQAWLLSHSVNEYVMTQFYPDPDPASSSAVTTLCSTPMPTNISNFARTLVESAPVSCELHRLECENRGRLNDMNFYVLESSVICGTGVNRVQRNQQIWVREQEQL